MNEGEKYLEITTWYSDINNLKDFDVFKREVEVRFNPYASVVALWDLKNGGFSPLYEYENGTRTQHYPKVESKEDYLMSNGVSTRFIKLNE